MFSYDQSDLRGAFNEPHLLLGQLQSNQLPHYDENQLNDDFCHFYNIPNRCSWSSRREDTFARSSSENQRGQHNQSEIDEYRLHLVDATSLSVSETSN